MIKLKPPSSTASQEVPMQDHPQESDSDRKATLILAWFSSLLLSNLPDILWREFSGAAPSWLLWSKLILLLILYAISYFWKSARELRCYFLILLVLIITQELSSDIGESFWWQNLFPISSNFTGNMLSTQLRWVARALFLIVVLFLIYHDFGSFYLVKGESKALAGKEGALISANTPWKKLGWQIALLISLGTLTILWVIERPSLQQFSNIVPMLPMILLLALIYAFSEELTYRSALLAPLFPVIGKRQSMLITSTIFALGHFYSFPNSIVGVLISFILGYFLSKSMLETKGFCWAWFIHFLQTVVIFSFIAVGSV